MQTLLSIKAMLLLKTSSNLLEKFRRLLKKRQALASKWKFVMFRADLHCHTVFSDGTLTPQQLLHLAKEVGLSGISITDHDTIEAYSQAPAIAKKLGILLGSGVEFSCIFQKMS